MSKSSKAFHKAQKTEWNSSSNNLRYWSASSFSSIRNGTMISVAQAAAWGKILGDLRDFSIVQWLLDLFQCVEICLFTPSFRRKKDLSEWNISFRKLVKTTIFWRMKSANELLAVSSSALRFWNSWGWYGLRPDNFVASLTEETLTACHALILPSCRVSTFSCYFALNIFFTLVRFSFSAYHIMKSASIALDKIS